MSDFVTPGGGPAGDPNGELSALPVATLVELVARLRDEKQALIDSVIDEIAENLRLRALGGARPDENITAMTERIIAERDGLLAENFQLAAGQCANSSADDGGTPICLEVVRLRDERDSLRNDCADLALLVGRLIHRMRAARDGRGHRAGDVALSEKAVDYLRRKGLISVLRDGEGAADA